jgi:prevent-host-death family protein
MKTWPMQEATACFSELLDACLREGPQMVTKHGVEMAVLVPARDWQRLQRARPTLKGLLLAPAPGGELDVPKRGRLKGRTPAG